MTIMTGPAENPTQAAPAIVIVSWMDGKTETFSCERLTTEGGVLYLHLGGGPLGSKFGLPVANIRVFKVER